MSSSTATTLTDKQVLSYAQGALRSHSRLISLLSARTELPEALREALFSLYRQERYNEVESTIKVYFISCNRPIKLIMAYSLLIRAIAHKDIGLLQLPFYLVNLLRARGIDTIGKFFLAMEETDLRYVSWHGRALSQHLLL